MRLNPDTPFQPGQASARVLLLRRTNTQQFREWTLSTNCVAWFMLPMTFGFQETAGGLWLFMMPAVLAVSNWTSLISLSQSWLKEYFGGKIALKRVQLGQKCSCQTAQAKIVWWQNLLWLLVIVVVVIIVLAAILHLFSSYSFWNISVLPNSMSVNQESRINCLKNVVLWSNWEWMIKKNLNGSFLRN